MLRRWKRKEGEPERDSTADDDDDDVVTDIASRLDAVTAPPNPDGHTIPTGRYAVHKAPPLPPEPHEQTFSEQYSTESLYLRSTDDPTDYQGGHDLDSRAYYDPENPWEVLGVPPSADWHTIVAAHRKLAIRYHPDRLHHLPPDEQEQAESHMREVNVAYTTLRHLHGKV